MWVRGMKVFLGVVGCCPVVFCRCLGLILIHLLGVVFFPFDGCVFVERVVLVCFCEEGYRLADFSERGRLLGHGAGRLATEVRGRTVGNVFC